MKRRDFMKLGLGTAAGLTVLGPIGMQRAYAAALDIRLADPAMQSMFSQLAPNALDPSFKFALSNSGKIKVAIRQAMQMTGLVNNAGVAVPTTVWGYGQDGNNVSWPGPTFEVQSGVPLEVTWKNKLADATGSPLPHLLPVDPKLHWCYSLPGYQGVVDIATDGVPLVAHLHGGHNDSPVDGNPEYFFGLTDRSRGPRFVSNKYVYDNSQPAGTLWYHDHALGITRLNVYTGLAGLYIIRDGQDTGKHDNPLGLPAEQYELGYAIQDRMFKETGELFFPAFNGDPAWDDFIVGEGADTSTWPDPNGPSVLTEFFGDVMVVNGKVWPKTDVEPRHYRLRLLNGCDSRFMRLRLRIVGAGDTELPSEYLPSNVLPFHVVGTDQGLLPQPVQTETVDFLPGERQDIVIDFSAVPAGSRVIMENLFGDAPYGGDLPAPEDLYPDRRTDRIMAFDVSVPFNSGVADNFSPYATIGTYVGTNAAVTNVRKLGLYEGSDEFGRLQPMLGTAGPTMAVDGSIQDGSMPWHLPITENPALGSTEIWEIYNNTEDAHPIHVHLVNFEVLDRQPFSCDLVAQPVLQHDGSYGNGYKMTNIMTTGPAVPRDAKEYGPKDMVTSLPGTITRIKMTFDKPGRYVWHCHILSHEDHEMMRPFHVGPGPF